MMFMRKRGGRMLKNRDRVILKEYGSWKLLGFAKQNRQEVPSFCARFGKVYLFCNFYGIMVDNEDI